MATGERRWVVVAAAAALSLAVGAGVVMGIAALVGSGGSEAQRARLTLATAALATDVGRLLSELDEPAGSPSAVNRLLAQLEDREAQARGLARRAGSDAGGETKTTLVQANRGLARAADRVTRAGRSRTGGGSREVERDALDAEVRRATADVAEIGLDVDALADDVDGGEALERELADARAKLPRPDVDIRRDANVTLTGATPTALAGSAIAGVGDVNGDGREEVAVAAEGEGRVYVTSGDELRRTGELGAEGFAISSIPVGDVEDDISGGFVGLGLIDVAPAGDVNGDGLADILVGAKRASPGAREEAGAAYVILGSRSPSDVDVAALGSRGFALSGPASFWDAGTSVSGVGDVNGDGRDDFAVGGRKHLAGVSTRTTAATGEAVTWVLLGGPELEDVQLPPRGAPLGGFRIDGIGDSLSRAGDVNGDGLADVAGGDAFNRMGIPGYSAVVFGSREPQPVVRASEPGDWGIALEMRRGRIIGGFTEGVGDQNGDGLADVAVGSYAFESTADVLMGDPRVDIVYGQRAPGRVQLESLGSRGAQLRGVGPYVAGAGDFNGDSLSDFVAATEESGGESGSSGFGARVFFGAREPRPPVLDAEAAPDGGFALDGAGVSRGVSPLQRPVGSILAGVGDLDGDGRDDLGLGAPLDGPLVEGTSYQGSAFLVYSEPLGPTGSPLAGTVSAAGLGTTRVGSPAAEAAEALGTELGSGLGGCQVLTSSDPRVSFLAGEGTVARIQVQGRGYATAEGIEVGDSETAVLVAYGDRVRRAPHEYDPGGSYLTVDAPAPGVPNGKVVFETDGDSVQLIRAGRSPEVELVEGCA